MHAKSIPPLTPAQIDTFWSKVEVHQPAACWTWVGHITAQGYGRYFITTPGAKRGYDGFTAHRIAYELLHGPVHPDIEIHHLCRNKRCCNPDHLQPLALHDHRVLCGRERPVAIMTHCRRGHEFTEENTIRNTHGHRQCRTCTNAWARAAWHEGRLRRSPKRKAASSC